MKPLDRVRILIVDDHEAVRRGLHTILASRAEWSVCGEAVDGLEAVEQAKSLRPDVVLMDISMPRMDGIEATRIIHQEVPEAEVIVISQNDPALLSKQAAEVDVRNYVSKSDLSRDLLSIIDRIVAARKLEQGD